MALIHARQHHQRREGHGAGDPHHHSWVHHKIIWEASKPVDEAAQFSIEMFNEFLWQMLLRGCGALAIEGKPIPITRASGVCRIIDLSSP